MNLKHLLSKLPINKVSRFNGGRTPSWNFKEICTSGCISPMTYQTLGSKTVKPRLHSGQATVLNDIKDVQTVSVDTENDEDAVMNEFLCRFVWIMRGKLTEVYTDADKKEIDAMLHIIVGKVVTEMEEGRLDYFIDSEDFSEDLWKTVKEVSSVVIEDMKNAKRRKR